MAENKTGKAKVFIALDVPEVMKKEIITSEKELPFWRWIPPKLMHVPLRFIGEVTEETQEALAEDFADTFTGFRMIRLIPTGYGFGPNVRRADSFHITVQKTHAFDELKEAVDEYVFQKTSLRKENHFKPCVPIMNLLKPPVILDQERISKWAGKLVLSEPYSHELTLFRIDFNKRGILQHTPLATAEICRP